MVKVVFFSNNSRAGSGAELSLPRERKQKNTTQKSYIFLFEFTGERKKTIPSQYSVVASLIMKPSTYGLPSTVLRFYSFTFMFQQYAMALETIINKM